MTLLTALAQEQGTMIKGMIETEIPWDISNEDKAGEAEVADTKGEQALHIHRLKLILITPEPIAQVQNVPNMSIEALNMTLAIQ